MVSGLIKKKTNQNKAESMMLTRLPMTVWF